MYILYKHDGSVKAVNLTDFIQKGNDGVNTIFLAIEGRENTDWSATVIFTLPDGTSVPIAPTIDTQTVLGTEYSGWKITIPAAVTLYEGIVTFSISVLNLENQVLFTYRNKLTINPSVVVPDTTTITYAQYQALLQYIQSVEQSLSDRIDELEEQLNSQNTEEDQEEVL